jgi:hypothetical protein
MEREWISGMKGLVVVGLGGGLGRWLGCRAGGKQGS